MRSSVTKLELDLYYVKTNSYAKFQVNIAKDDRENSGKPSGRTPSGLTDGQTDRLTDKLRGNLKSPGFTGRGLINPSIRLH